MTDSVSQTKGTIVSKNLMTEGVTPKIDMGSQFFCWIQAEEQYVEYFPFDSRSDFKIQQLTLKSQFYNNRNDRGDYQVTLKGWVFRDDRTGDDLPRQDEILFDH